MPITPTPLRTNFQPLNILPGLQAGQRLRTGQQQQQLNALKLRDYETDRAKTTEGREDEKLKQRGELSARGIVAAINAGGTPENMALVYESVTSVPAKFKITGKSGQEIISIDTDMGTIKGPMAKVLDYLNASAGGKLNTARKRGEAHAYMESNAGGGKVELRPNKELFNPQREAAERGLSFSLPKKTKTAETPEQKRLRALKTYRGKKEIDKQFLLPKTKTDKSESNILLRNKLSSLDNQIKLFQSRITSIKKQLREREFTAEQAAELNAELGRETQNLLKARGDKKKFLSERKGAGTKKDYGESKHPEGTKAKNAQGVTIITRNGKWVEE